MNDEQGPPTQFSPVANTRTETPDVEPHLGDIAPFANMQPDPMDLDTTRSVPIKGLAT